MAGVGLDMATRTTVVIPAVPNLPLGTEQHERRYQDQFSNVLRLYFNQLGSSLRALLTSQTNLELNQFPIIAASDSTNQYAGGDDVVTTVRWDSADVLHGWTLDPSGFASPTVAGTYNIAYSLQLANTDNDIHDVTVWLNVSGVDVPRSASKFTLQPRKSAILYNYIVAYSSFVFTANPSDQIKLYWATDLAATAGGAAGIFIEALPIQVAPFARPMSPSAVGSITFVSGLY